MPVGRAAARRQRHHVGCPHRRSLLQVLGACPNCPRCDDPDSRTATAGRIWLDQRIGRFRPRIDIGQLLHPRSHGKDLGGQLRPRIVDRPRGGTTGGVSIRCGPDRLGHRRPESVARGVRPAAVRSARPARPTARADGASGSDVRQSAAPVRRSAPHPCGIGSAGGSHASVGADRSTGSLSTSIRWRRRRVRLGAFRRAGTLPTAFGSAFSLTFTRRSIRGDERQLDGIITADRRVDFQQPRARRRTGSAARERTRDSTTHFDSG